MKLLLDTHIFLWLISVAFKLPEQNEEMQAKIAESAMRILAYDAQFGFFGVRIDQLDLARQHDVLMDLIRQSWDTFGRP